MRVVGAHHFSINASDVERSRAFYGGLLGLPEIERPDFGLPGIWYQAGPVQLHVIVPPQDFDVGTRTPTLNPIATHIAFEIEDYAAVKSHLEAEGLELVSLGPQSGQIFVRDPDGNVVELIDPTGQPGRSR